MGILDDVGMVITMLILALCALIGGITDAVVKVLVLCVCTVLLLVNGLVIPFKRVDFFNNSVLKCLARYGGCWKFTLENYYFFRKLTKNFII